MEWKQKKKGILLCILQQYGTQTNAAARVPKKAHLFLTRLSVVDIQTLEKQSNPMPLVGVEYAQKDAQ